jgi:hypothetical protein
MSGMARPRVELFEQIRRDWRAGGLKINVASCRRRRPLFIDSESLIVRVDLAAVHGIRP